MDITRRRAAGRGEKEQRNERVNNNNNNIQQMHLKLLLEIVRKCTVNIPLKRKGRLSFMHKPTSAHFMMFIYTHNMLHTSTCS
jgi:hypothetical protein